MLKKLGKIKIKLKKLPKNITGVFADEQYLYLVRIEKQDNGWAVTGAVSELLAGWCFGNTAAETVEAIRVCCRKNGFSVAALAMGVAEEKVFAYEKTFPLPLPPEPQRSEMIRLDILVNSPLEDDELWSAAVPLEAEGSYYLAAMDRSSGEKLCESFVKNGIHISALCPARREYDFQLGGGTIFFAGQQLELFGSAATIQWSHGLLTALMAALSLTTRDNSNFLPKEKQPESFAWSAFTTGAVLLVMFSCLMLFAGNCWQLYRTENKLQDQQERLLLVASDREKMRQLQEAQTEYRKANEIMAELSKNRRSYYGLLLYLGLSRTDGVVLSEINTDAGGEIYLQGQGSSFETVNTFLDSLRGEKELFKEAPQLEKTEIDNQGAVRFKLKGKIK